MLLLSLMNKRFNSSCGSNSDNETFIPSYDLEEVYAKLARIIQEQLETLTDIKEALGYDCGNRTTESQIDLLFSVLDEDFRRKHGGWDFLVTNTSGVEQFFSTLLEQEIEFYGLKLDEEIGD